MKSRKSRFSVLVAVAVYTLCAGAGIAQSDAERRDSEVKIFSLGDPNASGYEVVSHLWTDTWRSAFWLPTYPSQEQAISALKAEAARRGANGLISVLCLDQGHPKWSLSKEPAILCYGIAVRVRPS